MPDQRAPHIVVLMPFAPKYDRLSAAISEATRRAGAIAERVDQQKFTGDIVARIVEQIEQADAIVAVTTGKNPNVFYEVGFAHALRKDVILVTDNPKSVAFDLQHYKHVVYNAADDRLVTDLAEQLQSTLANQGTCGRGYSLFRKAALNVETIAKDLTPYLTPIARRACNQWVNDITALSTAGLETNGRERLEITRSIVAVTNRFSVIERVIGNPAAMHSRDWTAFFDEIATNDRITKRWTLCVPAGMIAANKIEVRRTWEFRRKRGFITRYSAADQVERSLGHKLPAYDAIEDYGKCLKFLCLPKTSYAPSDTGTVLTTIFKPNDAWTQQLLATIDDCAEEMTDGWIEKHCGSSPSRRESNARRG